MNIFLVGCPSVKIEDVLTYVETVLTKDQYHYDNRFDRFALTKEFAQSRLKTTNLLKPSLKLSVQEFNLDQELVSKLMRETYLVVESSHNRKIKASDPQVATTREGGVLKFKSA